MTRKDPAIEELLQFLMQNIRGFARPEIDSLEYERIADYAAEITETRNGSQPPHVKDFLIRCVKMQLRNILTPPKQRQTPSGLSFYPNQYSFVGFLGWGESLNTILAEDKRTLGQLKRTAEDVGAKLKQTLDNPPKGTRVQVISSHPAGQDCPFCKVGAVEILHANRDYSISRGRHGIVVPGLAWHLIGDHGFFEGKLTQYRIDPILLVKVLFG